MQKKIKFCIVCLVLIAGAVGYYTFAYFTAESTTTNVISTGYVEMELYEEINSEDIGWEFIPIDEITSIWPGDVVGQKAYVTNVGTEDFYCRISYEIQITDAEGNTDTLDPSVVSLNIDPERWVEDSEGWYRYVDIVPVGETTEPLFTEVSFSTEMDNSYMGCIITIIVGSQSVQSEYNEYDINAGETVLDVDGFADVPAKGKGGTN